MPNKDFLENSPLFKLVPVKLPATTTFDSLPSPPIKMHCGICEEEHTFNCQDYFHTNKSIEMGRDGSSPPVSSRIVRAEYKCTHCGRFERLFFVKVGPGCEWLMKVGQDPPWDIKTDPALRKKLGRHAGNYQKGRICESQGYGIGAFAYYRRVTEEIIGELLEEIPDLLEEAARAEFKSALIRVKETNVAAEKIEVVREMLPASLRLAGQNPLSLLHSLLSQGLHAGSDEDCLDSAAATRGILEFLVSQILTAKDERKGYADAIAKALEKKQKTGVTSTKLS